MLVFFFQHKNGSRVGVRLVGSEMCIRASNGTGHGSLIIGYLVIESNRLLHFLTAAGKKGNKKDCRQRGTEYFFHSASTSVSKAGNLTVKVVPFPKVLARSLIHI